MIQFSSIKFSINKNGNVWYIVLWIGPFAGKILFVFEYLLIF